MPIEDIFSIEGRGTVVTGKIERGVINVGEDVEIVGIKDTAKTTVTGIEMFNKNLKQGMAGDNAGILIRGIKKEDVTRGQVLVKPGTVTPHSEFECEVYILKKEEGGRHTPFFTGYKPQFYIRTTDVTGEATLPAGVEMVMPGDTVKLIVKLVSPIALEDTMHFAIREGIKKYTVNRASFVFKNAREQFEIRIHKRVIDILNPNPKTIEALTSLSLPSGIDIDVKIM